MVGGDRGGATGGGLSRGGVGGPENDQTWSDWIDSRFIAFGTEEAGLISGEQGGEIGGGELSVWFGEGGGRLREESRGGELLNSMLILN